MFHIVLSVFKTKKEIRVTIKTRCLPLCNHPLLPIYSRISRLVPQEKNVQAQFVKKRIGFLLLRDFILVVMYFLCLFEPRVRHHTGWDDSGIVFIIAISHSFLLMKLFFCLISHYLAHSDESCFLKRRATHDNVPDFTIQALLFSI